MFPNMFSLLCFMFYIFPMNSYFGGTPPGRWRPLSSSYAVTSSLCDTYEPIFLGVSADPSRRPVARSQCGKSDHMVDGAICHLPGGFPKNRGPCSGLLNPATDQEILYRERVS